VLLATKINTFTRRYDLFDGHDKTLIFSITYLLGEIMLIKQISNANCAVNGQTAPPY